MKRGLIAWDKTRLPESAFTARLETLNQLMTRFEVPAIVVYTDVWRSNDVRFVSNFMPYWNRAFAVTAHGQKPVLLCSLSPRVYPWIKTVTIHDTIIASPSLPGQLEKLAAENGWPRIGILDHEALPHDLYTQIGATSLEVIDIPRELLRTEPDVAEIAMHRHAATIAREAVAAVVTAQAGGLSEFDLVGRIEKATRRAGAEDLVALVSDGDDGFRPATGQPVGAGTSLMAAVEYSGHWAKVVRNVPGIVSPLAALQARGYVETLSAGYPWQPMQPAPGSGSQVVAMQLELPTDSGVRLFYGDTGLRTAAGTVLL